MLDFTRGSMSNKRTKVVRLVARLFMRNERGRSSCSQET
jgi:hypothetical protein